jgi:prepilin-type processing-associated H-X9-DG protein
MSDESVVRCPHCGHVNPLMPQGGGRVTVTCASCGNSFPVAPAASPSAAAPPQMPPQMPQYAPPGMSPLGYAPPPPPGVSTKKVLFIVLACVLGLGVIMCGCMVSILLPSLNRAREQANRIRCASNMRQIGQAIQTYANANRGEFPDTLERALVSADLDSIVFVCPSSADDRAPGADAKAQAANLSKGGHLSYVYVGKGMNVVSSPGGTSSAVVLYEPLTNHNNDGTNVLFADGHVEFFGKGQAQKLIADVQAGANPPNVKGY